MARTAINGDIKLVAAGSASGSSAAVTTTAADTQLFGAVCVAITKSAGTIAVTCQSSDDGSTYAADTNIIGDTALASTATEGAVAYIGSKRYVKFIVTPASATFSYAVVMTEKRTAN